MTAQEIRIHLNRQDRYKHSEAYMKCVEQLLTLTDEQLVPIFEWHTQE